MLFVYMNYILWHNFKCWTSLQRIILDPFCLKWPKNVRWVPMGLLHCWVCWGSSCITDMNCIVGNMLWHGMLLALHVLLFVYISNCRAWWLFCRLFCSISYQCNLKKNYDGSITHINCNTVVTLGYNLHKCKVLTSGDLSWWGIYIVAYSFCH